MNPTRREQYAAAVAVCLLHWGLFKLLASQGTSIDSSIEATPLRVRFIERELLLPSATSQGDSSDAPASSQPPVGRIPRYPRRPESVHPDADTDTRPRANEPLNLTLAISAAPDFSRRPLEGDTRLDRFAAPPERIPMRKPLTGKDVIEGTAQILGFWPPGYTTDPCPRIRRNIDELKTDGSAAGRERLDQEMARQTRYCP